MNGHPSFWRDLWTLLTVGKVEIRGTRHEWGLFLIAKCGIHILILLALLVYVILPGLIASDWSRFCCWRGWK